MAIPVGARDLVGPRRTGRRPGPYGCSGCTEPGEGETDAGPWDNLNVHKDRRLREFIDTHDWITCYFLPPYAPDLNPVEGIWSLLRRNSQVNTAFTDSGHLISTLRHGLRQIRYRSNLINGCLAETGLTLTTSRRQRQSWLSRPFSAVLNTKAADTQNVGRPIYPF